MDRSHTFVQYSEFGPTLFSMFPGAPAPHGEIVFRSRTIAESAPYIVVNDASSADAISAFMSTYWKLPRADVIISVMGSARDLKVPPRLDRVLRQGIRTMVSMSAEPCFFTGGTDDGVMKYLGDIAYESAMHESLIAITPYGGVAHQALEHPSNLVSSRHGLRAGDRVEYDSLEPAEGRLANMNPHHTHFIFVHNQCARHQLSRTRSPVLGPCLSCALFGTCPAHILQGRATMS